MFVALGTQHAMLMRHIVICGLLYNMFPRYLINGLILEKKNHRTQNVCYEFLYKVYLKHFTLLEEISEKRGKVNKLVTNSDSKERNGDDDIETTFKFEVISTVHRR